MTSRIPDDSVSLNKFIADTGFCSRREADKYIEQGRVTINGKVARTGNRVPAGAEVELDGEPLGRKKETLYIAYHKPVGVTSTTDTKDKTNIIDAIGHRERIFPVGRLDKDSEGLIFLTNDGNIVNKILRAGNQHEKEYVVRVDKPVDAAFIKSMSTGVKILDTVTQPCKVVQEGKQDFRITLQQGLNRQIRRMCTALGFEVQRLKRVRIMNVHLGKLASGQWRYLTPEETKTLMQLVASSRADAGASKGKSGPAFAKAPADKSGVRSAGSEEVRRKGAKSGDRAKSEVRAAKNRGSADTAKRPAVTSAGDKKAASSKKSSYKDFKKGARKRP